MALTAGSVQRMFNNDTAQNPIVQLLEVKQINGQGGATRYRLIISDGQHFMQAMLATQLNALVDQQQLQQYCIVRLNEYLCNVVQNRKIIIILNLHVISSPGHQIGNPARLEDPAAAQGQPPPQQQQQPYQQQQPPPYQQQQPQVRRRSQTCSSRPASEAHKL